MAKVYANVTGKASKKVERLARSNAMALTLGAYALQRLHELQEQQPEGDDAYWHAMASIYVSGLADACNAIVAFGEGKEGIVDRIIDKIDSIEKGEVTDDAEGLSAE